MIPSNILEDTARIFADLDFLWELTKQEKFTKEERVVFREELCQLAIMTGENIEKLGDILNKYYESTR